jgi:hypothetical protein
MTAPNQGQALSALSSLRAAGPPSEGRWWTEASSCRAISNFDQEKKMSEAPKLNALIPELYYTSIKASIAFYTEILGFEILY